MAKKTIGYGLIAIGVIIAVVSLAADVIGIGNQNGIGWQQILGAVVGVVIIVVGIWQVMKKPAAMK